MSNQQQMDDFFKEAFNSYSPEVPAGTWERIADTRKKRRVALVWWRKWLTTKWLIVTAITGLIIAGGFYFSKDKEMETAIISSANSTKKIHPSKELSANTAATSKEITGKKADLSTEENIKNIVKSPLNNKINEAVIVSASSSTTTYLKPLKRKTAGKMTLSIALPEVEEANIDNNTSTNNNPLVTDADKMDEKEQQLNKMPFSFSAITAMSLADISHQQIVLNGIRPPGCPPAEKDAAGNKMYWEVYTGVDYASKKYTDTGNSVFLEKRKATTSFQSAYSAGVRFTRVFNNGVSFRTGLNYSQINEKFSFIQSNLVQTTYIIDAVSGDTTGSYTVRGTRYKTTFNKYRSLDIPLLLGYEVGNGRFHANFNAGAIVNLYSWQQGELLDTNYQPISITTGKGNDAFHYKTNAGIGFTAAASMYYKLNDRLHLLAEPYFRYSLSPMSKDVLSLQERFTTIGLRLGIRIDLQ
jgi:hypothetical protein